MILDLNYLIYMLPAVLLALIAQLVVKRRFRRYGQILNSRGITGAEAARAILMANGIGYVQVVPVSGTLTDHYDPKEQVIRLSGEVYGASSVSAVGVAAHEAGHAVQHAENYGPLSLREAILPICTIGSRAAPYLILLGIVFSITELYLVGVFGFILVAFFQLVTLPVEFNASRRAVAALTATGQYSSEELDGVQKVLRAAALTYVAGLAASLLQILRLIMITNNRRN